MAKAARSAKKAETAPPRVWGYIEGYYGRLFGWEERAALVDQLASGSATGAGRAGSAAAVQAAYLYAPKEDSLHRRDWRIRYPAEWRKHFRALAQRGARRGVEVIPGMAPGLSF